MTLTDAQRATLVALVDTVVPSIQRDPDPTGFWATPGSVTGAQFALELLLTTRTPPEQRGGLLALLDALDAAGFGDLGPPDREQVLAATAASGPEAAMGVRQLIQYAALLAYSLPDERGRNPYWPQFGYPGPVAGAAGGERPITPLVPAGDLTLTADVVVVGSGAGGGTIAGVLAAQGRDVVVLEAGGYFSEADFVQLEVWAHEQLYYRHGLNPTADGNVVFLAGSNLGGGTTINWQNCVQPSAVLRRQWAEHGLTDVATPEFDRHLAAVMARMSVNEECSVENGPHQRLREGAARLGWAYRRAALNWDPRGFDPDLAGYTHFGDLTGAKLGTQRTYLQDAADAGARILVRTRADRVLVSDGRAAGVQATYDDGERSAAVTVRARDVVLACGALETPAVLLRSGIGGPAVGHHLRLHPASTVFGFYPDEQRPWWGPPQAGIVEEFAGIDDGYGYLIEASQYYTGVFAAFLAWNSGLEHKTALSAFARMVPLVYFVRERGSGRVTIDDAGEAVHTYAVTDELDQRHFRDGLANTMRLHAAAGATEIHYSVPGVGFWRRGEDLEAWIARLGALPIGLGGLPIGCAHQMGSARMGADAGTSVADPRGELHDVSGVWIGDTSAFPTASGANPMLTCMALAHRTAEFIGGQRDKPAAQVDLGAGIDEVAGPVM